MEISLTPHIYLLLFDFLIDIFRFFWNRETDQYLEQISVEI